MEKLLSVIKTGEPSEVEALLRAGACAQAELGAAREKQPFWVAVTLVRAGGDVNARWDDGSTPLTMAVQRRDLEAMTRLVEELGADAELRDLAGRASQEVAL